MMRRRAKVHRLEGVRHHQPPHIIGGGVARIIARSVSGERHPSSHVRGPILEIYRCIGVSRIGRRQRHDIDVRTWT